MNQSEINSFLKRKIKSGKRYDFLIPKSSCNVSFLEEGDTEKAIKNMAFWSKKYQNHTKKLTPIFEKHSLEEMCEKLHKFLFEHFQYKIDSFDQNLRSPACAWASRKDGIDCKSYSIFASTVLLNLGVSHYLRRVKQAENEGFTHVYVIVPKDQNQPKNLKKGYYVIDGTINQTKELPVYQTDDVYMEAELPIYGLAGAREEKQGLSSIVGAILQVVSPLLTTLFSELMAEVSSCHGTRFPQAEVIFKLENSLKKDLEKLIKDLNEAIEMQNRPRIQRLFNKLLKEIDLGHYHLQHELSQSAMDWCTGDVLKAAEDYVRKTKEVIDKLLENYKKTNTAFELEMFTKRGRTSERTFYFVVGQAENPVMAEYRHLVLRDTKKGYAFNILFPFGDESEDWYRKHYNHLAENYGKDKADEWERKITPIVITIGGLREKYRVGGETLYYAEQPLQRDLYKIWLQYDEKYKEYLKKEAESLRTANELSYREFKKRFEQEIKKDRKVKKNRLLKKQIGIGGIATALTSLILIKPE